MLPACREFLIVITFNSTGYWLLSFSRSWILWYYVFWSLLLPVGKPESFLLVSITYCICRSLNFQSLVGSLYFGYLFFSLQVISNQFLGSMLSQQKHFIAKVYTPMRKALLCMYYFLWDLRSMFIIVTQKHWVWEIGKLCLFSPLIYLETCFYPAQD